MSWPSVLAAKTSRRSTPHDDTAGAELIGPLLTALHDRVRQALVSAEPGAPFDSIDERDNRVMRYAETLAKRGDQVDVMSLHLRGLQAAGIRNGVRVLHVQERTVNERNQISYLIRVSLFFLRAMIRVSINHIRKPYQLVHVHSVPDFLVFTAWLPRLMGAKIILDVHDLLPEFYADKFHCGKESRIFKVMVGIEKISCAFAHHVILPNHIWLKRVQSRSVTPSKSTVVLNYPDPPIFYRRGRSRHDACPNSI